MSVLVVIGLAVALAWSLRPQGAAPTSGGIQVILPPIPLSGVSQESAESMLSRLQPSITPRVFPAGWTVSWPSLEIPSDFGTAKVDLPTLELPFMPSSEVLQVIERIRPQLVNTVNGLALQVTASVGT